MTPETQQVDVSQIEMDTITVQVQVTHKGTTGATETRLTGVITIGIDVNIDIASRDKIVTTIEMIEAETETMTVEPHREKTGLQGFRPGATQIGLYSHRSRLDT